jgi:hypothetical protein
MKNLLLFFVLIAALTIKGQSIPNNGFESWNIFNILDPLGFHSSNTDHWGNNPQVTNVTQTTDSYSNMFAVKLTTTLNINGDTLGAFMANGDPSSSSGQGIPYNQSPTGIQFRYKCNIMSGDTGLVLAIFKQGTVTVGAVIVKITGNQNTYALKTAPISLAMTPDTMIFAAASSNLMVNNFNGIPGSWLQLDSVRFNAPSQPSGLNGDFELWQTITEKLPMQWTINSAKRSLSYQTTDKASGSYALELITKADQGVAYCDEATTGYPITFGTGGGYPYTNQSDTLIFSYKYAPATPTDSGAVSISFKKNNVFIHYTNDNLAPASVYTKVKFPFSVGMAPDTVIVQIKSSMSWSNNIACSGSNLKVDDIYFASQVIPVTSFVNPPMGCVNQSLTLMDNSYNLPTAYSWTLAGATPSISAAQNPTVTYASAGTYTILHNVSNSNGSGSVLASTVSIGALPIMTSNSATICIGKPANLFANGGVSYMWSNGFSNPTITVSPTVTTNYTVTGTGSNGCPNTSVSNVLVNALPVLTVTSTHSIVCPSQTATLTANGASTYTWTGAGMGNTSMVSPTVTTVYTVTGTDANGCENMSTFNQVTSACTGVQQSGQQHLSFTIYPNPNNGIFTVNGEQEEIIFITNALGQTVTTIELNFSNSYRAEVKISETGIYFANGRTNRFRIVVVN